MNLKLLFIAMLVAIIGACAPSYLEWKKEVYTNPEQLRGLPSNIVIELKKMGCLIPQGILDHTNAIEGEFAIKGQKGLGCPLFPSKGNLVSIFFGEVIRCPSIIAEESDQNNLYEQSRGVWEYDRGLAKVGEEFIMEHYEAYRGTRTTNYS